MQLQRAGRTLPRRGTRLEFNQDSYDGWCGSTGFLFLSGSLGMADPAAG